MGMGGLLTGFLFPSLWGTLSVPTRRRISRISVAGALRVVAGRQTISQTWTTTSTFSTRSCHPKPIPLHLHLSPISSGHGSRRPANNHFQVLNDPPIIVHPVPIQPYRSAILTVTSQVYIASSWLPALTVGKSSELVTQTLIKTTTFSDTLPNIAKPCKTHSQLGKQSHNAEYCSHRLSSLCGDCFLVFVFLPCVVIRYTSSPTYQD
ncbi:hypothetical protein QBC38DRAFT_87589 [Podospora fimiseda]|uniref:Uncharacterized protein n=1 Tax=Podospora fimiseda TaxID=252190 RepID=A0AAN6YN43_9PEZI|nr:hypothetical protein QBC38DRAFT_87589 [Podospora fimiseda]